MRPIQRTLLTLSLLITWTATAQELPFQVFNFLKVEYDDNVFTTGDGAGVDAQESFKIVEQIEFLLDSQQGNTYYGVRYSPSLVWFEDRPGDSSDVNHQLDLILNQDFSPRTSLNLQHILRAAEEPELVADDVTFRNNNDYIYNSFDAQLLTQVVPNKTSAQVSGRFVDFSYDDDEVAAANDYQEMTAGLDLIQVVQPETTVSGQVRYSEVDYDADFRDFDTTQIGLAASKVFNPKFEAEVRGGVEMHRSDDPIADDLDTPYVSGSLKFLTAQSTRVTLTAGYAQDKSPVVIFSTQEKTTLSAS
ncbi:MAG: outer membrane beta-barrel protein, partial [Kiritimatiellia bacterium]